MNDGTKHYKFEKLIKTADDIDDTVKWTQRNSFREGTLAINIGNDLSIDDYDELKNEMISLINFDSFKILM